jgi:Fe2+ or Zn2+ uptake regulation protein
MELQSRMPAIHGIQSVPSAKEMSLSTVYTTVQSMAEAGRLRTQYYMLKGVCSEQAGTENTVLHAEGCV